MVLRMLYNDTVEGFDLGLLGYIPEQSNAIEFMKATAHEYRIIAGPTGSGKSTTLQRVQRLDHQRHWWQKERDHGRRPSGIPDSGSCSNSIDQRERVRKSGVRLSGCNQSCDARLDPDVMMIGEIGIPLLRRSRSEQQ